MLSENHPPSSSPRAGKGSSSGGGGIGGGVGVVSPRGGQDMKRLLEEKEEEVKSERVQTVALSEQVTVTYPLIAVVIFYYSYYPLGAK